ncbi:hypothetical protein GCM10010430_28320 [Kitasatospora cystarginea]|uniref:PKS/mFAS DH domain-containing protein n=1 Tax=Kitasatospora cystarginea TaxID=58350 RepID=A0ABN3DZ00_9ACTN
MELHWVLSEHKLLGEAIVPGTTYLEMARAAASLHFGRPVTELRDVTFLVPLLVQEGTPRTAHTTIRELDDLQAEFTVASHDPASDHWTVHVQGTVGVRPHTAPAPQQDLAALRELCSLESVDIALRQTEHKVTRPARAVPGRVPGPPPAPGPARPGHRLQRIRRPGDRRRPPTRPR